MSFTSWLLRVRSYCRSGTTNRKSRRAARCEPAKRLRLQLEVLEDRITPSFSPITSYSVGTNPQAVVTADFNNDGRLDLATASSNGGNVSVRLGDSQGSFGDADEFATGNAPVSLVAADFNNDGRLDLAATNGSSDWTLPTISLLIGEGDGTFGTPIGTYNGHTTLSAAAGDFNADGIMDLVYTIDYGPFDPIEIEALLGDGQGGFQSGAWAAMAGSPVALAVADLNANGMSDVVTANYNGTVTVLLDNDWRSYFDPGYTEYAAGQSPRAIAIGDFTGDGIPDVVTAGQTVDILPGVGNGTFDAPISHSANTSGMTTVAAADFNGDGKLDVVTADPAAGIVSVFLGNGDGTLTAPFDHAAGTSPVAVAVGDFNGDGRPDVTAADGGLNSVLVLLNDGNWNVQSPPLPSIILDDATIVEGNTSSLAATFNVTLSAASTETVTVAYTTANGSATAGSDYQATSGTLTFAPGETSKTITVLVNGDTLVEPEEAFAVHLSNAAGATIADGQAAGTIINDDVAPPPSVSISDVSKKEGRKGQTTLFTFTVTLSAACDQPVTMSFTTANGTASTSDNDYVATSGAITFAPGETTKTITVVVKGDRKKEANENFFVDLSNLSSYAVFLDSRGTGTILNDD